jgi:hypothetical protein
MGTVSGRPAAGKWDIRRLPTEEGADANAAWTETYPARVLGMALTAQSEFWEHVAAVRAGEVASTLARRYVKRDVGRRVELIATYIECAAAGVDFGRGFAETDVWNIAARA